MLCPTCQQRSDAGIRCEGCQILECPRCADQHRCPNNVKPLWPHQARGIKEGFQAARDGHRVACITIPTGGGKTRVMVEMAKSLADDGRSSAIFTNRRILTTQIAKALDEQVLDYEILASGYNADEMWGQKIKLCSADTFEARVGGKADWHLPDVDDVFFDEAHSNKKPWIIQHYRQRGKQVWLFTATPVGLVPTGCTKLIQAGTNSELRECGALVACDVFAPDEPDMQGVTITPVGEYVQAQMRKRIMQTIVFGDVFDHWRRLNPFAAPTLLFAPGIEESRWFCEQFEQRGVRAAHLDGSTSADERGEIFERSMDGHLPVISSCGVLREGADLPWIVHGILVQPCGALSTYLQIVGRLLRSCPGRKNRATLQDHAGAWHRHGSPNADRLWELGDTDVSIQKAVMRDRKDGKAKEPIRCPKCKGIRLFGLVGKCPHCGHEHTQSIREVRMLDGTLARQVGPVTPVKAKARVMDDQTAWTVCLRRAAHKKMTVQQAAIMFNRERGHWPNDVNPMPPKGHADWKRRVGAVYSWTLSRRKGKGSSGRKSQSPSTTSDE